MKRLFFLLLIIFITVAQQLTATEFVPELKLPAIPSTLREPSERALYLIEHFWDNMDWQNRELTQNEMFMEQNLANYFDLFPHAGDKDLTAAIDKLLTESRGDSTAFARVLEIADKYLYEQESPLFNEQTYTLVVKRLLRMPELNEYYSTVYEATLEDLVKNQPGSNATDFSFIDRQGTSKNLSEVLNKNGNTILFFYDPDCENCKAAEHEMQSDSNLNAEISAGKIKIVCICPYDVNLQTWKKHAESLPAKWVVGYSPDGDVDTEQIYVIRSAPTTIIIDKNGIVLHKNIPADTIIEKALVQ